MAKKTDISACLSPVAAYDALAPYYDALLDGHKRYLQAVEKIVAAHATNAGSLLDIGSGNGVRALRIAKAAHIDKIVLIEPSEGMRRDALENGAVWKTSILEIPESTQFPLITCLWNVLGHLEDSLERKKGSAQESVKVQHFRRLSRKPHIWPKMGRSRDFAQN